MTAAEDPAIQVTSRRRSTPDGRVLRSQRTRAAIVDANVALLLEGVLRPTAAQIAERAGVSTRALWTHFPDLESLFEASGQRTLEIQYEGFEYIPADLPLEVRIERFCAQRSRMLESIAGASRSAQTRLPFSAQLRKNRARHNSRLRTDIGQTFAPEIATAGVDADELVNALLAVSTWPCWTGSRDDLGLSVEEAAGVMQRTVRAILLQHLSENAVAPAAGRSIDRQHRTGGTRRPGRSVHADGD